VEKERGWKKRRGKSLISFTMRTPTVHRRRRSSSTPQYIIKITPFQSFFTPGVGGWKRRGDQRIRRGIRVEEERGWKKRRGGKLLISFTMRTPTVDRRRRSYSTTVHH